ncbi:unnamed protein product [Caenorhabditis angaria]|uniref:Dienelactone hydrolase domain-containing protein n=1 Tax=Caenorhabditis angaria TaxID=860376 RepID=A0A9P1MWW1_9PELO|nr:unnamed protein product [Caenorhabditis angaria]
MPIHKLVQYSTPDGTVFEGELYTPRNPENEKLPAVLVLPAFRGITEFEKEKALILAKKHHYIAFAVDVYGKGIRPTERAEAFATMKPIVSSRTEVLKPRLLAALETVKNLPNVDVNRIGAIGFCFGGLCVLDLARHQTNIAAVVSFHGTLLPVPDLPLDSITETSIQVHHGDADTHISKEQVDGFHEEMRQRNADFVFSSHAFAKHSFTEPEADSFNAPGVGYNKNAAERSWNSAIQLFKEKFIQHT